MFFGKYIKRIVFPVSRNFGRINPIIQFQIPTKNSQPILGRYIIFIQNFKKTKWNSTLTVRDLVKMK